MEFMNFSDEFEICRGVQNYYWKYENVIGNYANEMSKRQKKIASNNNHKSKVNTAWDAFKNHLKW